MSTDTATATRPTYRVMGTTDEVTACDHCGRVDLKGTVRLGILDADGNVEDVTYFGATCAAKAAGRRTADIRKEAGAADRAAREAEIARRDADRAAHSAAMELLRYTEGCPLGPRICVLTRREDAQRAYRAAVRPCVAHD